MFLQKSPSFVLVGSSWKVLHVWTVELTVFFLLLLLFSLFCVLFSMAAHVETIS